MMKETENGTWFAVVNGYAGGGRAAARWVRAEAVLRSRGVNFRCGFAGSGSSASELACGAADGGFRKFIAVGGDGTVHDVLCGIMRSISAARGPAGALSPAEFYLAVIPAGSGNDWIRSHGVPCDPEAAASMIADGSFAPQDIVRVSCTGTGGAAEETFMANIAGYGLDAGICDRVNAAKKKGKSGRLLYAAALVRTLFSFGHSRVKVICDGRSVYEGECLSMAFGTGRYSGGGMRQTPEALTGDGLTDVTIIPPLPLSRILSEGYKLFTGDILTIKEISSCRGASVTVLPADGGGGLLEIDGEVAGTLPARFDVLPERINVLHQR